MEMHELRELGLHFPALKYGRYATPWDFFPLLFQSGAALPRREASRIVLAGELGRPCLERLSLVLALHEEITSCIVAGNSQSTVARQLNTVRSFFRWADEREKVISLEKIEPLLIEWIDFEKSLQSGEDRVKPVSLYQKICTLSSLVEKVCGYNGNLLRQLQVRKPRVAERTPLDLSSELSTVEFYAFGHFLLDLCEGLDVAAIRGKLPIRVKLRNGEELEEWSGLRPPEKLKAFTQKTTSKAHVIKMRAAWEADISIRTRRLPIALRVQSELLIFIAQTGMNLAQVYKLKQGAFSYSSFMNGYQVRRVYKNRRKGEVEFEIFSAYRPILERYLKWRKEIFSQDEEMLFPLNSHQGRSEKIAPEFVAVKSKCAQVGVKYFGPQKIRKTRQNWLLDYGVSQSITAEMGQHSVQTLLKYYREPTSAQYLAEIADFHALGERFQQSVGPGLCERNKPSLESFARPNTPVPDCMKPSGCLFCVHQRDVASFDHVWSLATYRYYKIMEVVRQRPVDRQDMNAPVKLSILRLDEKIERFNAMDAEGSAWVQEALLRVAEGEYHKKWDGFIRLMED